MLEVIHLDTIVWRVHPLPQYGSGFLTKILSILMPMMPLNHTL